MNVMSFLAAIQTTGVSYQNIHEEIINRCVNLGLSNVRIGFSCLHDSSLYVVYEQGMPPIILSKSALDENLYRASSMISLSLMDELASINPSLIISYKSPEGCSEQEVSALILEFTLRVVQRQRAVIRRLFIEAKIGSYDVGTFCYRFLNESFINTGLTAAISSIFILDKYTNELRLRAQKPRRDDKRHISDIALSLKSKSWVSRAFRSGMPAAEFNQDGGLQRGRTKEQDVGAYYARVYWPIQLQFRLARTAQQRSRDPTLGVIRLSNPIDSNSGEARPFHCFDGLALEFIAESLYNIVSFYVDGAVEGFDKDLAFHAAKTPAVGCLRNIKLAAQLLFSPNDVPFLEERPNAIPPQFDLIQTGMFGTDEVVRALNNAYAFALNISSQIERANITEEIHVNNGYPVDRLFADVLQKCINLIAYHEVSHSLPANLFDKKRVQVNRIFDLPLPPPVMGDIGDLSSVFNNIFENCIKYGKRDEVTKIEISWVEDEKYVTISVTDNGIGIPEDDVDRIFTAGVRSERAKVHTVRGNGLGLAHCLRVVKSFGGNMKAIALQDGLKIDVRLRKAEPRIGE